MARLEGKVALVTGGNSGIGLASAKAFAREGAQVIITGRNQETLDQAQAEIGEGTVAIQGDVSDLSHLDDVFATVKESLENSTYFSQTPGSQFRLRLQTSRKSISTNTLIST